MVKIISKICLFVLTWSTNVTDGRTDRQTDGRTDRYRMTAYRACITSRGKNASQHVPIYLQQFPSYSNSKCKKSLFSRTASHIFVSRVDAPATITQYVAWMERQFNAWQTTPRSMYLSIFNSFRVIRCLSQCVSPKIAIFTTFLFPL